jgi:prevent-host-death family protein
MERQIGATDLRQKLTDVLQAVREGGVAYVVETFGRPQAAVVGIDEYRRFQQYQQERESFIRWMEETAQANAVFNAVLSEAEVLALIEQAREAVSKER